MPLGPHVERLKLLVLRITQLLVRREALASGSAKALENARHGAWKTNFAMNQPAARTAIAIADHHTLAMI
jgi:hypothetical protein